MKLTLDVVEFYPSKKKTHVGTLHVYIRELGMDIRGCRVYVRGKTIAINVPYSKEIDKETDEAIGFPIVSFTNEDVMNDLKKQLKEKGIEYLKENFPELVKKREGNERPSPNLTQ